MGEQITGKEKADKKGSKVVEGSSLLCADLDRVGAKTTRHADGNE